jgi:uncharacterized low-complexity protein
MDKVLKNSLVAMATAALGIAGAACGDEGGSEVEAAPEAEATSGDDAMEASCGAGSCGGAAEGDDLGGEEAPEASCGEGSCG